MINADDSGAANTVAITVTNDSDSVNSDNAGLSQLAYNANESHLTQSSSGRRCIYLKWPCAYLVNEPDKRHCRRCDVTLNSVTTTAVSLSISRDSSTIKAYVESFVSAFNEYVGSAKSLIKYDADTGEAGSLQGMRCHGLSSPKSVD